MYAQSLPEIEQFIGQKIPVGTIDPALLALPPPRHHPAPPEGTVVVEEDDGSIETRPPPRKHSSRGPERRPERRSDRGPERRPERARPAAAAAPSAAAAVMPARSEAVAGSAGDGARRRSRGGRGRRGAGVDPARPRESGNVAAAQNPRGESARPEPRSAARSEKRSIPVDAPPAATAVKHEKPGFFRRLGRLFKRS